MLVTNENRKQVINRLVGAHAEKRCVYSPDELETLSNNDLGKLAAVVPGAAPLVLREDGGVHVNQAGDVLVLEGTKTASMNYPQKLEYYRSFKRDRYGRMVKGKKRDD